MVVLSHIAHFDLNAFAAVGRIAEVAALITEIGSGSAFAAYEWDCMREWRTYRRIAGQVVYGNRQRLIEVEDLILRVILENDDSAVEQRIVGIHLAIPGIGIAGDAWRQTAWG